MGAYTILAEALQYPSPGRLELLERSARLFPSGAARPAFQRFLEAIQRLSLAEWEELHTRTLDLNPPAAPYVGFQLYGESYQRGNFMAQASQALQKAGVKTGGELPDHLAPLLRYLDAASTPEAAIAANFTVAVQRMLAILKKAEPTNPYLYLFEAVLAVKQEAQ